MKAHGEVEETLPLFLPLALDRDERSAPHPIRFTSGEKQVGPRDGLDALEKETPSCPCVGV